MREGTKLYILIHKGTWGDPDEVIAYFLNKKVADAYIKDCEEGRWSSMYKGRLVLEESWITESVNYCTFEDGE